MSCLPIIRGVARAAVWVAAAGCGSRTASTHADGGADTGSHRDARAAPDGPDVHAPPSHDAATRDAPIGDVNPVDARADGDGALPPPLDGAIADAQDAGALQAGLASLGYAVQTGQFGPIDLAGCCSAGATCYGSNPLSPYFGFYAPPAPGQTAANPTMFGATDGGTLGLSSAWRLEEGEAMVYLGPTPPTASYFGFTPYLFDRAVDGGRRETLFASLSDTTNDLSIHVAGGGSAFGAQTVVIATADARTAEDVRTALGQAGYDPASYNTVVFDASQSRFGVDEAADAFSVLFRVAEFAPSSASEGAAWVAAPHGTLLRVTPVTPSTPSPLAPIVRDASASPTERTASIEASVAALKAAILARYPGMTQTSLAVVDGRLDPLACIAKGTDCEGDNPDTNYPLSAADSWPAPDAGSYFVYGVDHAKTGKTAYSSFSLVALAHAVGVAGMSSATYAGSAAAFVPTDPNVDLLYACQVAGSCPDASTGSCCLAVTGQSCPSGIAPGARFVFMFRTYLDPTSDTAPDPSTLMPESVLKLTPP